MSMSIPTPVQVAKAHTNRVVTEQIMARAPRIAFTTMTGSESAKNTQPKPRTEAQIARAARKRAVQRIRAQRKGA